MLLVSDEGTGGKVDYWECWRSLSKNCLNYWFIYPSTNFSFRSVSLLWDLGVFPSFRICVCRLPASRPGVESRLGYAPPSCPRIPNSKSLHELAREKQWHGLPAILTERGEQVCRAHHSATMAYATLAVPSHEHFILRCNLFSVSGASDDS